MEIQPQADGIYLPEVDFWLDAQKPVHTSWVSHAHGDHFHSGIKEVFCTKGTSALLRVRGFTGKIQEVDWDSTFQIRDFSFRILPAGHIPGSAMLIGEKNGKRFLYSGDIHPTPHEMAESLKYPDVPIDLLICESTFGNDGFVQEDPNVLLQHLLDQTQSRPLLFGVYALGKAQRLCAMIHKIETGRKIYADSGIINYFPVYQDLGFDPGPIHPWRRSAISEKPSPILLLSPPAFKARARDLVWFSVWVSGWKLNYQPHYVRNTLPISDHADKESLLKFVKTIQPKQVFFNHGYSQWMENECEKILIKVAKIDDSKKIRLLNS